jgi:hypothetical protein
MASLNEVQAELVKLNEKYAKLNELFEHMNSVFTQFIATNGVAEAPATVKKTADTAASVEVSMPKTSTITTYFKDVLANEVNVDGSLGPIRQKIVNFSKFADLQTTVFKDADKDVLKWTNEIWQKNSNKIWTAMFTADRIKGPENADYKKFVDDLKAQKDQSTTAPPQIQLDN